jgi:hypothetical protein
MTFRINDNMIIQMYYLDHEDPHIHIMSPEGICRVDFEGNVLKGNLPINKLRVIKKWISLHKDELEHNWTISRDHLEPERIKPWVQ